MVYIILACLLAMSAFFSGSETALFSLERQQLAAYAVSRNPFRRLVTRLLAKPRRLLVTVLLGNLLVNVTFYAMASAQALDFVHEGRPLAGTVFGILTPVVVIVFGEVTPKTLALGFSGPVATVSAPVLMVLRAVFWPVRVVVSAFTRVLGNLLAGHHPRSVYVTPEELKMLITTSETQGVIDRNESVMMQELVDFGKVLVRDVMVPRVDMVMFRRDRPLRELREIIRRTRHSAIPVYGTSVDDIVGIVMSREALLDRDRPVDALLHRVWFVPETKTIESLLDEFRREKRSFAVVVDEYGGTAGLVTLEDVVEAIVGEIHDEYDTVDQTVSDLGNNRYLLPGRLSIAEWTEMFGLPVADRRLATLGGLVVRLLGHLPHEGEQVRFGNVLFTVKRMRG
ncbi:MAG TPA: hemolysin family protein, partial [Planctomycetota bacterium]|nr:hemolysin family protein [Planctomycetota bacterium]